MKLRTCFVTTMISMLAFSIGVLKAEEKKTEEKTGTDNFKSTTIFDSMPGPGIEDNGGYGAPFVRYGNLLGKGVAFSGLRGAWIINHRYSIGLSGTGLATKVDFPEDTEKRQLGLGYGGFLFEYVPYSDNLLHLYTSLTIGAGGISKQTDYDDEDNKDEDCNCQKKSKGDSFFVAEPEVAVEANVASWCRIGLGASYRFTQGAKLDNVKDKTISGVTGFMMVRFGSF